MPLMLSERSTAEAERGSGAEGEKLDTLHV
jgi:hypothetical protein